MLGLKEFYCCGLVDKELFPIGEGLHGSWEELDKFFERSGIWLLVSTVGGFKELPERSNKLVLLSSHIVGFFGYTCYY